MRTALSAAIVMITLILASQALAHSTRGRLKIPLEKETVEIDDVAYYIESHVNRVKYKDDFTKHKNRFIVDEFLKVNQVGDRAVVNILVLDKKTNEKFKDSVTLHRNEKGIWQNPDDPGAGVYTYVNKHLYYYTHYLIPGLGVAALLASLNYLFQLVINRMKKRTHA